MSPSLKCEDINTLDHDGLRGICAVWIMLYHCFLFSTLKINLLGSTQLPLYFILSGFSLTIGYYDRFGYPGLPAVSSDKPVAITDEVINKLNEARTADEPAHAHSDTLNNHTSITHTEKDCRSSYKTESSNIRPELFYFNRLVRTMPIYYIGFLLAIPMTLAGYNIYYDPNHNFTSTLIVNIIPVATWLIKFGNPLDGPAWFVQTCLFCWLFFPYLLQHLKPMHDNSLLHIIRICFILQMIWVLFFMTLLLILFPAHSYVALYVSTMFPLSRLPLFTMGICAAILTLRHSRSSDMLPWFSASGQFFPFRWLDFYAKIEHLKNAEPINWNKSVTIQGGVILVLTLVLIILTVACAEFYANIWLQAIIVFAHMDLLVGLVLAKGGSILSNALRHPIPLWLGEISFCLFQTHWLVIFYLIWAVQGHTNDDNKFILMPAWGIPVVCVVSLVVAAFLHYAVEIPVRQLYTVLL